MMAGRVRAGRAVAVACAVAVVSMSPAALVAQEPADSALRTEALARLAREQGQMKMVAMNFGDTATERALRDITRGNARWLDSVVKKGGWPTALKVGDDGENALLLIVQHANDEPKAQQALLGVLRAEVKKGRVGALPVAVLEDRIRVSQGKPQLYGTQAAYDNAGAPIAPKVERPKELDTRRKALGLVPMKEFLDTLRAVRARGGSAAPRP